jgi:hypothetical protein
METATWTTKSSLISSWRAKTPTKTKIYLLKTHIFKRRLAGKLLQPRLEVITQKLYLPFSRTS